MGLDVLGPLALQSLDGFILLINSEGLIQFVSENVVQYLGQTPSELETRSIFDLVHEDDASKFSANLKLVDGHQVSDLSTRSKTKQPTTTSSVWFPHLNWPFASSLHVIHRTRCLFPVNNSAAV